MQLTWNLAVAGVLVMGLSYLLGSLSFAIIVTKAFSSKDIRDFGSGNAGMSNVLRTQGKLPAFLTCLGDFSKGIAAVVLGNLIFQMLGGLDPQYINLSSYLAGLFAVLGHLFPVFYHFKGGKGILTASSVILLTDPWVFVCIIAVFLAVVLTTHVAALGSIAASVSCVLFTWISRMVQGRPALVDTLCVALLAGLVIFMHRANIKRLLDGTENRFGSKSDGK